MSNRSRTKIAAASLCLILSTVGLLAEDVVELESGRLLTGIVVSFDNDQLVLDLEAGQATLDRNQIRSIHFDTTPDLVRRNRASANKEVDNAKKLSQNIQSPESPIPDEDAGQLDRREVV